MAINIRPRGSGGTSFEVRITHRPDWLILREIDEQRAQHTLVLLAGLLGFGNTRHRSCAFQRPQLLIRQQEGGVGLVTPEHALVVSNLATRMRRAREVPPDIRIRSLGNSIGLAFGPQHPLLNQPLQVPEQGGAPWLPRVPSSPPT